MSPAPRAPFFASLAALGALGGATPALAGPLSPVETLRMNPASIQDALMDGMDAYTLLVPEGWSLRGGVTWNALSTWAYVGLDALAQAPDGSQVQFFPNGSFTYFDSTPVPGMPQEPRPRPGQMTNGKMFLHPGQSPADFVTQGLFPGYRPEARNLQIIEVTEVEEVARQYRQLYASVIESHTAMQATMAPGLSTQIQVGCPLIRVRYTENGRSFEEQFTFMYHRMDFGGDLGMGMKMQVMDWSAFDVRGFRAPAGSLDGKLTMLQTISSSLTPTRRWKAIVDEINKKVIQNQTKISQMRHQSHMEQQASLRRHAEKMRRVNDEIMDSNHESWEKRQASDARISRAWSNAMHGVDDYTMPDGSIRSLDSSFKSVFVASDDTVLFTDDVNFDPNVGSSQSWSRVHATAPSGDAANR